MELRPQAQKNLKDLQNNSVEMNKHQRAIDELEKAIRKLDSIATRDTLISQAVNFDFTYYLFIPY